MKISSDLKTFSKPYILFVGSRAKYKNFSFFLNSYANSKKLLNQFDLILFGGGKLTSQELKLMNLLGIEKNSVKQINGKTASYMLPFSKNIDIDDINDLSNYTNSFIRESRSTKDLKIIYLSKTELKKFKIVKL